MTEPGRYRVVPARAAQLDAKIDATRAHADARIDTLERRVSELNETVFVLLGVVRNQLAAGAYALKNLPARNPEGDPTA